MKSYWTAFVATLFVVVVIFLAVGGANKASDHSIELLTLSGSPIDGGIIKANLAEGYGDMILLSLPIIIRNRTSERHWNLIGIISTSPDLVLWDGNKIGSVQGYSFQTSSEILKDGVAGKSEVRMSLLVQLSKILEQPPDRRVKIEIYSTDKRIYEGEFTLDLSDIPRDGT